MIGDLKQVTRYLKEPEIRVQAQKAVDDVVTEDTRVLVAHSLGSVVTYEALHTYSSSSRWKNVATLVTIGSPLGIPKVIFDRLKPQPAGGKGKWPPGIKRWVNISDDGDVVGALAAGDGEQAAADRGPDLCLSRAGGEEKRCRDRGGQGEAQWVTDRRHRSS